MNLGMTCIAPDCKYMVLMLRNLKADVRYENKGSWWGMVINLIFAFSLADILCSKEAEKTFIEVAKSVFNEWYGESLQKSEDLPRMPNERQYNGNSEAM